MIHEMIADRIAEACGIEIVSHDMLGGPEVVRNGCICLFDPWNDATDAVLAAEKYGFDWDDLTLAFMTNGKWRMLSTDLNHDIGVGTFSEAICQAILFLESKKR